MLKTKWFLFFPLLIACSFIGFEEAQAADKLLPRQPADKAKAAPLTPNTQVESVVVKFQEGSRIRLRGQGLVVLERNEREEERLSELKLTGEQVQADLHAVEALVASHRVTRGRALERLFNVSETDLAARRASGEARSGQELADLDLYYQISVPAGTTQVEVESLLAPLNALASVEIAYAKPPAAPAVDIPPTTPNFEGGQGYLDPAPVGIDARYAWTVPGGKGQGARIVDVEGAWNLTHEDLPSLFHQPASQTTISGWRPHGTAVLGEMIAPENGYGVTGIAHQAQGGAESFNSQGEATAITNAAAAAGPGGLVLIEIQFYGPATPNSPCNCSGSCCDCVPVEYYTANFDAIAQATANGTIVVEAGANGATDLDDPVYGGLFNRSVRDSGAILVGASNSADRAPTCFTNYGSRIDVHGWGWDVTTLGYGSLFSDSANDNQDYIADFSGTSSASPIVTGSGAVLQGVSLANGLGYLSPSGMRQLLRDTGTPQAPDSRQIGPLPNLRVAIDSMIPPTADFMFACTGQSCSFNGSSSTDNIGVVSWSWSFGDGTFGSGVTVNHTYATNGTRLVTLTVSDAAGGTGSRSRNVSVNDNPPVAAFTVGCTGRVCSANGSTSSDDLGISDFQWTWGDSQITHTSTATTSHTYAVNGTYGIVLKVTDTVGQTDTEGPINVTAVDNPPVARLTVTCSGLFCEGNASASTDDLPGLTFGYSWEGEPPSYQSTPLRTHRYASPGLYTIAVTARDSAGQTSTVSVPVNVHGTTAADTVAIDKGDNEFKLRLYLETGVGSPIKVVITGITGKGIAGDWNGDHVSSMGRFVTSTATFSLRNTNSTGAADLTFVFGTPGATRIPVAGDWNNDGTDTIGLYNPATGTFSLRNSNSAGAADVTFTFTGAASSWIPIAGDWNGDGTDTVGLYDPATSTFYLRNSNTAGGADLTFVFGTPAAGLVPNAGDWNGDGWDSIGVFDPATGVHSLRDMNKAGTADYQFTFTTNAANRALAGDWDGI
jgi:PKD repeat protein